MEQFPKTSLLCLETVLQIQGDKSCLEELSLARAVSSEQMLAAVLGSDELSLGGTSPLSSCRSSPVREGRSSRHC